jgi:CobQ-like glutamine amidotransferase family enzyme
VKVVVGHLYPDYLNIYADRGNIAVLSRRAAWRGHELEVRAISIGNSVEPGDHDLLYIGGGQDREQALVAEDLVEKADGVRGSVAAGAAKLAAGISSSAGRTAIFAAPNCRESASSHSTPSPARRA